MSLLRVYEDQARYKHKIKSDESEVAIIFENQEPLAINYTCSSKEDLYFATRLFLEAINGFGVVNFNYLEIKQIFEVGRAATFFKACPESLHLYKDKGVKGFIIGFLIGNQVSLQDIALILEEFTCDLPDEALAMFTAVISPSLEPKGIEIVLVNIV